MNKQEIFNGALRTGDPFRIVVSVPHGAELPDHLSGPVVLDIGEHLPIPTFPTVDEDGIYVELSFDRVPFECFVPWRALSAVATHDWTVSWPLGSETETAPARAAHLRVVK